MTNITPKNITFNLKRSMAHPAAIAFVARLNDEEDQFRLGMHLARAVERSRDEVLFINQTARRPKVEWTTEVRLSRRQRKVLCDLIAGGWSVWCSVVNVQQGATAVVCKLDSQWAMVYETGKVLRGIQPELIEGRWPQDMDPSTKNEFAEFDSKAQLNSRRACNNDQRSGKLKPLPISDKYELPKLMRNANGSGFSFNRYN
jgi:hypothetical protein